MVEGGGVQFRFRTYGIRQFRKNALSPVTGLGLHYRLKKVAQGL